jgi:hypothetical protein
MQVNVGPAAIAAQSMLWQQAIRRKDPSTLTYVPNSGGRYTCIHPSGVNIRIQPCQSATIATGAHRRCRQNEAMEAYGLVVCKSEQEQGVQYVHWKTNASNESMVRVFLSTEFTLEDAIWFPCLLALLCVGTVAFLSGVHFSYLLSL